MNGTVEAIVEYFAGKDLGSERAVPTGKRGKSEASKHKARDRTKHRSTGGIMATCCNVEVEGLEIDLI